MSGAAPLLLIEDTPSLQLVYQTVLRNAGHSVVVASNASEGSAAFARHGAQVVILDLMLPDRDGLEVMRDMLARTPQTRVVVITANGSINKAVEAMRLGAYEFLVKPFDEGRFLSAIDNALKEANRNEQPTRTTPALDQIDSFIGDSAPMQEVYKRIRSVSRSMATVFVTGESGTGKEICAQAIHDLSNRADKPFVPLNCGAIPPDLLESEVFGHLQGSFPGAIQDKSGAAADADGGTLFLDDICEMDLNLQTKLLRFLQTSTIQPVGATHLRKVDARIVSATNRNPLKEVRAGRFREDLYFRLQVVPIHLPPLRERGEDIVMIARETLARLSQEEGHVFTDLEPAVLDRLRSMPWPGNVRQLQNLLRTIVVLNEGPVVTLSMLPRDEPQTQQAQQAADAPAPPGPTDAALDALRGRTMAEIEQMVIEHTIARHGGSVPRAARALDLSPSTIYRKRENWQKHQA